VNGITQPFKSQSENSYAVCQTFKQSLQIHNFIVVLITMRKERKTTWYIIIYKPVKNDQPKIKLLTTIIQSKR